MPLKLTATDNATTWGDSGYQEFVPYNVCHYYDLDVYITVYLVNTPIYCS